MDTITLYCGSILNHDYGQQEDLVPVELEGELIAETREFLDQGGDRYHDWELYKDKRENYWLYSSYISRWRGESSEFELAPVSWLDFQPGGDRAKLGRNLGLWEKALSPEEYIKQKEQQ